VLLMAALLVATEAGNLIFSQSRGEKSAWVLGCFRESLAGQKLTGRV
jgi:hypothetical protein